MGMVLTPTLLPSRLGYCQKLETGRRIMGGLSIIYQE
jgi:hypothetical protein